MNRFNDSPKSYVIQWLADRFYSGFEVTINEIINTFDVHYTTAKLDIESFITNLATINNSYSVLKIKPGTYIMKKDIFI